MLCKSYSYFVRNRARSIISNGQSARNIHAKLHPSKPRLSQTLLHTLKWQSLRRRTRTGARLLLNLLILLTLLATLVVPVPPTPSFSSFSSFSSKTLSTANTAYAQAAPETFNIDLFLYKPAISNQYALCGSENCNPSYANNGADGDYWRIRNVNSTTFWRVDVGTLTSISQIKILQGDAYYATSVDVYGGIWDEVANNMLLLDNYSIGQGLNTINLPDPHEFRYYWIVMQTRADTDPIPEVHINTIQGFGARPFSPPPGDVFRYASSDGSCIGAWCHHSPQMANDGLDGSYWSTGITNNYWTVYLGTRQSVGTISLYQAPLFEEYATSVTVRGSNSYDGLGNCPHDSFTTLGTYSSLQRGWNNITLPTGSPYLCYWINANTLSGTGNWQVLAIEGYGLSPKDDGFWSYNPSFNFSSNHTVAAPLVTLAGSYSCAGNCDALVSPLTGNFNTSFGDLALPGRGPAIGFARSYNSRAAIAQPAPPNEVRPLGYGWTHTYNMYIEQVSSEYVMHQENGSVIRFNSSDFNHPSWIQADLVRNADQTYVMTRTHGLTVYSFNSLGRLTSIRDRNGHTTTLSYNGQNYLQTVTDPASRQLSFTYTVTGTVTYLTGVSSSSPGITRNVSFGYDSGGNLQTATDVGGQRTGFSYDANHQLEYIYDPRGGVLHNTYEAVTPATGRVVSQTDPENRTTGLYYSAAPGTGTLTTQITNSIGLRTDQDYNDYRLMRVTQFPGTSGESLIDFSYKPGTMWWESVNDPNSNVTSYVPDSRGNITSASDPLGRTTQYVYNTTNDLTKITYANQMTTTLDYDGGGNVVKVSRLYTETGQVISSTFAYDTAQGRAGDLLTVTDPVGKQWNTRYDAYGYPTSSWDPLSHTSVYTYNSVGWLMEARDPVGRTTSSTYTAYGLPYVVTDSRNYTTTYGYDANQNLRTVTDANYRTVTYDHNLDNELTRVTRPDTTYSTYDYDGLGRVITQSNPLRQNTVYGYDDVNRISTVTDLQSHQYQTQYNLVGLPTQILDPKAQTTTFIYDVAYQLKRVDYSDTNTPDVQYNYDVLGMRSVMTDGTGVTLYDFDSLNRPISVQDGSSRTITFGYDQASRLSTITYPNIGSGTRTVTRGYDNSDRLTSVQDWLGNTTQFTYDASDVLTGTTYPAATGLTTVFGYNNGPQLTSVTHKQSGTPFLTFSYTRDNIGVLGTGTEVRGSTTTNHTYEYDSLYRLRGDNLSSTNTVSNTWGYSAATEIIHSSQILNGGTAITTTRVYNPVNALSTILQKQGTTTQKDLSFTFDNNGNRIQLYDKVTKQSTNYTYDQADRLKSYGTRSYAYNGDGLRMSKAGPVTVEQYTWDPGVEAGLPLLLQDASAVFIYGPGGMLLEEVSNSNDVYFYHTDQLGSVRALTNSSGSVVNTYDYDAYGIPTSTTGSTYNPFGFSGEYLDYESGLIYLRARYYDPATQQFLTRDPLENQSQQPYAYGAGNPLAYTDPTGHFPFAVILIGALVGGGMDLGFQLISNGGDIGNVNWAQVGISAGFGAFAEYAAPVGMTAALFGGAQDFATQYFSNGGDLDTIDWGQVGVSALFTGISSKAGQWAKFGKEWEIDTYAKSFGVNMRHLQIAPFGNRTPATYVKAGQKHFNWGILPHAHYPKFDRFGNILANQGYKKHRPWQGGF
jgi:RHS repeat-associated protein